MNDHLYLPDPVRGQNRSQVYVSVKPGGTDLVTAKRYLSNPPTEGARLKRVYRAAGETVLFEVIGLTGVRVGRSAPTQDPSRDIADIRRVLGEACILEG